MDEVVLLLDDDVTTLNYLDGVLAGAGFACSKVSAPAAALDAIRSRPEIAVVVSDICMPDMSGLQFVEQVNRLDLQRRLPAIVMLTAHPTLEGAVDALRLGAYDFLIKPVSPTELVDVVTRALARVRRGRETPGESSPSIESLIRQAEGIAGALRRFAPPPVKRLPARPQPEARPSAPPRPGIEAHWIKGRVPVLEAIERLRKLRLNYEEHKLDDIAWDLLLELLRADQKHTRLSVSALTISIPGVSSTTSLRRIGELQARGYIERVPDAHDRRRDFVGLTPKSRTLLVDYLSHADSCLVDLRTEEPSGPPPAGGSR